ncbi:hypothetical protein O6P43_029842 [Quillaja saponaria]|uniref:Uncharacterized protein n=1 Tax=Quillaja saponaria TaxID=32244 RepID=A0AAD7PC65_QUISA|nr:hypothetical protein O6P43_029842 [Quillaja saponaria]
MARGILSCDNDSDDYGIQPLLPAVASNSCSENIRRKPKRNDLNYVNNIVAGDIFYGQDDYHEYMNDFMYKEDVIESMRRESAAKANRKKRREHNNSWLRLFKCFDFFNIFSSCFGR